jgi:diguanylate cyclase (GGDEF)-like protein
MFQQRMQLRELNQTTNRQRHELEQLALELEAVARRDALTGAGNRLALDEDLAEVERSVIRTGRRAAALILDIDHFKAYNDRFGHLAGDDVLRRVVEELKHELRPGDRVYRFGGEEFLVLLPETDAAGAGSMGERLRAAVAALAIPLPENDPLGVLTISAGAAALAAGTEPVEALLRAADQALYAAKGAGRNRVVVASPGHGYPETLSARTNGRTAGDRSIRSGARPRPGRSSPAGCPTSRRGPAG